MDVVILFVDILLIFDVIGLDVWFEKGVGLIVEIVNNVSDLNCVLMEKVV